MARRSRMSMLKRQRELKKNEKASHKRAKKHGLREDGFTEPVPTVGRSVFAARTPEAEDDGDPDAPGAVEEPTGEE